jgi:hypothetical protein
MSKYDPIYSEHGRCVHICTVCYKEESLCGLCSERHCKPCYPNGCLSNYKPGPKKPSSAQVIDQDVKVRFRGRRFSVVLSDETMDRIKVFSENHTIRTEAEAVLTLIEIGLQTLEIQKRKSGHHQKTPSAGSRPQQPLAQGRRT